ncbi:MAG TPA: hypothetical protein PL009_14060 [Flavipsychrobacter sp.]|nr:hypothetical protein [Flavipsychrobacter sp.]
MPLKTFPGFLLTADELSAFCYTENIFVITTKNQNLIRFVCLEPENFLFWLESNQVRNIHAQPHADLPVHTQETSVQFDWLKQLSKMAIMLMRKMPAELFVRKYKALSK